MYEWLPQQMMSLLRVRDAPRYVVYCYGQTLKPAPGGDGDCGGTVFRAGHELSGRGGERRARGGRVHPT